MYQRLSRSTTAVNSFRIRHHLKIHLTRRGRLPLCWLELTERRWSTKNDFAAIRRQNWSRRSRFVPRRRLWPNGDKGASGRWASARDRVGSGAGDGGALKLRLAATTSGQYGTSTSLSRAVRVS